MQLDSLIAAARTSQASDLHLEPGQPICFRVRGQLRVQGEPVPAKELLAMVREFVGKERWPELLERRSCDLAKMIAVVRCRINALCAESGSRSAFSPRCRRRSSGSIFIRIWRSWSPRRTGS